MWLRNRCYVLGLLLWVTGVANAADLALSQTPLFISQNQPPLTMLVMGRNHKLYYEAYNDASDLNGDGIVDVRYKPATIDYFGYFDSYKCYEYNSAGDGLFEPTSVTADKTCSGSDEWSGDFLNYLSTARIDALRKVFYGGDRSTDTSSETVLERTHIPQDAHSWGKEYTSITVDGYDIADYTPLSEPPVGYRHLFANTTLLNDSDQLPRLRVLTNTAYRVWEWVSIERPVAGSNCNDGSNGNCTSNGPATSGGWTIVPDAWLHDLTQTTYRVPDRSVIGGRSSPANESDFDTLESTYANATYLCGSQSVTEIDGVGNPFSGVNGCTGDDYMTIFEGKLQIPSTDTLEFAINGDDAVEFQINNSVVSDYYNAHGASGPNNSNPGTISLLGGTDYDIKFRHHERGGGDSYELYFQTGASATSRMTDYTVRVKVCDSTVGLENNCKQYGASSFKPTGILQDYGENDSMMFGLLSGSYEKNTSGGVLRKNVSSFTDEVDSTTGVFNVTPGIVDAMNKLKTAGFGGNYTYGGSSCSGYFTNPLSEGNCQMWGNPIAEMMYETMRYFAGKGAATPAYAYTDSGSTDNSLGLTQASWQDPYSSSGGNFAQCSRPFQIVISDINPNYDSDQLPGSAFASFSETDGISGLNVQTIADSIWNAEVGATSDYYIGHSIGNTPDEEDFAPTAKTVDSFGDIRGLSPEEPTKQGSYYSASLAYYGKTTDLNSVSGDQMMETFAVALASPLPRIEIPINNTVVTLVPFGKSVGGCNVHGATSGLFLPTNQIVDFYVENIAADGKSGTFRINFEDVEYGNDHDMDAIVEYSYQVNDQGTASESDDTITVSLDSNYAAGCVIQHMGYVISGTTSDGTYLEVRDKDTGAGSDPDYQFDTPPGEEPGGTWNDGSGLPLSASRTFTPGSSSAASFLKDPLWYAAKWGGFQDSDEDDTPANTSGDDSEWDEDGDGDPDNYFQVTNALGLGDQLSAAFEEILSRTGSSSSVAVNSGSLNTDTLLFQARFNAQSWTGELRAFELDNNGFVEGVAWNASEILPTQDYNTGREIITYNGSDGVPFRWPASYASPTASDLSVAQVTALLSGYSGADPATYGANLVNWLRGDDSNEDGVVLRDRTDTVLGDIVNSDPIFVGNPLRGFPDDWPGAAPEDSANYSDFVSANASRKPMVYVGSNDGMMHAFQATSGAAGDGKALLSFVPSKSISRLPTIASPNYSGGNHLYTVDGGIAVEDTFFDSAWHTVLVGALGGGGQGIYALDITSPSTFDESQADNIVLWEFSDTDDVDLGYTFGKPAVGRFANGKWLAVVGNGYNNTASDGNVSTTGNAVLYLLDVETGAVVAKIDTLEGTGDDPTGNNRPNGLNTPSLVDVDGDFVIDYIYVGDLFGNVWKFDVTDSTASNWDIAYGNAASPEPFYTALNDDGDAQPITARPEVGVHPNGLGDGIMVYFGTGQYLEAADNSQTGQDTQSFYSLWDPLDGTRPGARGNLLEQTIEHEARVNFDTDGDGTDDTEVDLRATSDNTIDWSTHEGWYMDFLDPDDASSNRGERQISDPLLRAGRIIFSTLEPSDDVCVFGGSGWLMELDASDGGRIGEAPFDANNDGVFDQEDFVEQSGGGATVPPSGLRTLGGIPASPTVLAAGENEVKAISLSSGAIETVRESSGHNNTGRQTWRKIK